MILKKTLLTFFAFLLAIPATAQSVDSLINSMTPEEKFWQLYMIPGSVDNEDHDYTNGSFGLQIQPALTAYENAVQTNRTQKYFIEQSKSGIPIIPFEEALHGLKRPGATAYPQAISLAATWDTDLMHRVSEAVSRETRSRGIRMVLSPVVNIASDVRWGRTEETYGEDPYLSARMGEAFVTAFESNGIITTPKHFVANVSDGGRDSWPVTLDQRTLMEIHYPPFKAAFDAGARSVMTAYNSVDGVPATQNDHLLNQVLKEEWGFDGFVISDAAATGGATVLHLTEPNTPVAGANAYKAGLDVVFQSSWPQHTPYMRSITDLVPDEVTNAAVQRILNAKQELGLFHDPYVDPDSAAYWNGHADHMKLAREAAAAGMVLLKNEDQILPLTNDPASVLVIGDDATEARLGGYSGPGIAPVSMLDGLTARFGDAIEYIPGIKREKFEYEVIPQEHLSLNVSYYDNPELYGDPVATDKANRIDNRWTFNRPARGMTTDWYSIRWEGELTVGDDPVTQLGIEGDDGWRLYLDGELLIDNWEKVSYNTTLNSVNLKPGTTHSIKVEYYETTGDARIRLIWDAGVEDLQPEIIQQAVAKAQKSELAVVVAGIEEGEFRDRAFLGLPAYQEELIEALAETDTPVIVVLVGGSAITMPWLGKADAVIMAWYPGEQGGHGLTDILTGDFNPSGRLPITFPVSEGQLPLVYNHRPTGRGNDYLDLSGKPLFPFGYGLSYTSFDYSNLTLSSKSIATDEEVIVSLEVTNTGDRAGHEVVQLYIRDILATVVRPVRELKGFERIYLEPGESKTVTFTLGPDELKLVNRDLNQIVEPGEFRIYVGASSRDIRLRETLTVE
jgi:beta-glucosidase